MPLPSAGGTYVLVLELRRARRLAVGGLGSVRFGKGYYLYVGSALGGGGLRARLQHHLAITVHPRWHIDYLRRFARPLEAWISCGGRSSEAEWVEALEGSPPVQAVAPGFGASDSRCASHLFFSVRRPRVSWLRNRVADDVGTIPLPPLTRSGATIPGTVVAC
ncbi:MAG: GIY-YIG nuclease family protein [Planctomycetota bacterium]